MAGLGQLCALISQFMLYLNYILNREKERKKECKMIRDSALNSGMRKDEHEPKTYIIIIIR